MATSEILDSILDELAAEEKIAFRKRYQRLLDLVYEPIDLQHFLDEFLLGLGELLAANAGAIWFRDEAGNTLVAKARLGLERLGLDETASIAHQRLLADAMLTKASVLVKPFSAPVAHAKSSNPTDSFLLLGPIVVGADTIAVVELALGPRPARGQTPALRQRYTQWLDHLTDYLTEGIRQRFLNAPASLQPALNRLVAVADETTVLQQMIRDRVEQSLASFSGKTFGSLKANQEFAKSVHDLLESHGFRVICPECGNAAILRCQNAGNTKTGVFVFDHYLETGRTFHGGPSTFPTVKLTTKPPRRKRSV